MTAIVPTDEAVRDTTARHIVPLSGGKDSTALAIYMLERHGDLPLEFVFTDTGAELPETYEYFKRFESIFGITVERTTALARMGIREKGDRTPFDIILEEMYGGFLPNPQARWCTRMLKIRPFEQFVGTGKAYSYIAIRGDENREGFRSKPVMMSEQQNIFPVYPFKDASYDIEDVKRILDESGLGVPPYYEWRSRSGCYFCFYQQIGEWQGLKERHPDLFEKSKRYEKIEKGRAYTWSQGRSLADVEKMERRAVSSIDDLEGCAICHL